MKNLILSIVLALSLTSCTNHHVPKPSPLVFSTEQCDAKWQDTKEAIRKVTKQHVIVDGNTMRTMYRPLITQNEVLAQKTGNCTIIVQASFNSMPNHYLESEIYNELK